MIKIPFFSSKSKKKVDGAQKANSVAIAPDGFADPLELLARAGGGKGPKWNAPSEKTIEFKSIDDYPVFTPRTTDGIAMDGETPGEGVAVMDDEGDGTSLKTAMNSYTVPTAIMEWFSSQSFIGYQACAILAQHWLIDKACSMAGDDAARNGWELKVNGTKLDEKAAEKFNELDKRMRVKENLTELNRFRNVFGIRVAIFKVDSDDPKYYEKPFNIDGVTEDSYLGISQVDPYWMSPLMTNGSTLNPSDIHFYDPEYWVISGKKYHRSHLVISRGPQPADILKPTYIFGGIPLTQRIYERVYAAERTANEAPLLAMNKRTTALHVDMEKAMADEVGFLQKLLTWVKYRDNHAIKVLGEKESIEQFDTSLADFDAVIMNQYQLVAAIAKTPATKLLGTSPKGFNATGEFEMLSYHEELESIHKNVYDPLLDRHYQIAAKSMGLDVKIKVVWEPVDSITAKERADLNLVKAQTDQVYTDLGSVSPDEVRNRVREDKHSGFNSLSDESAETEMGMTPEAIADLEKAGAEEDKASAIIAQPVQNQIAHNPAPAEQPKVKSNPTDDIEQKKGPDVAPMLQKLLENLTTLMETQVPEGVDLTFNGGQSVRRTVEPGTVGAERSVGGINEKVPARDAESLWRVKVGGLVATVENPRGSIRQGKNNDWQVKMPHHYGFLNGTVGADGDEVDCFIGPNLKSKNVYVIHQKDQNGKFDEHKCMLGFDSQEEAENGYQDSYSDGWTGMGPVVATDINSFRRWVKSKRATKPMVDVK